MESKNVTEHNLSLSDFKEGQIIKVYVTYLDLTKKHISLSISTQGGFEILKASSWKEELEKLTLSLNPSGTEHLPIGTIHDYKVHPESATKENFLVLKSVQKPSHLAIILKEHLSDYSDLYSSLLEYYKHSKSPLRCRIIQKI